MNKNKLKQSSAELPIRKGEEESSKTKSRQQRRNEKRAELKAHALRIEEQKKAWESLPKEERLRQQEIMKQIDNLYRLMLMGSVKEIYVNFKDQESLKQATSKLAILEEENDIQLQKERNRRYVEAQEKLSKLRFEEVTESSDTEVILSGEEKEELQFILDKID